MNPGARPHERQAVDDLEAELGALGAVLRSTTLPELPPARDAAILAAAEEAARHKRHGGGRWSGVLAAAATVSLAVGIGWHAARDPQITTAPAGAQTAAAPAAPALDRGTAPVQPVLAPRATGVTAARSAPILVAAPDPIPAPVAMAPAIGAAPDSATGGAGATAPVAARAAEAPARPDPVAWLARIDALRRAGHPDEAAREEALLDATWPGWREGAAPGR